MTVEAHSVGFLIVAGEHSRVFGCSTVDPPPIVLVRTGGS